MSKIVLINCYFGKLPSFFELFLKSCEKNKEVDFLIFSDNTWKDLPDNVKIVNISFEELKKKIQSNFDFDIALNTPYKICDYRPAYGYIFGEYLNEYEFWGYCDFDMIFGNIDKYLTDEVLNSFDKIYQFGHLTIIKNTKINNTLFMDEGNPYYKDVFQTDVNAVFDEINGIQKKFLQRGLKVYTERDYADITPRHHRFLLSKAFVNIPNDNFRHQIFAYEDGKVFRYYLDEKNIKKEEFIYIHIQKRDLPVTTEVGDKFFITYKGFIPYENEVTIYDVKKYNKFKLLSELRVVAKHRKWKILRKIRKIRGKA